MDQKRRVRVTAWSRQTTVHTSVDGYVATEMAAPIYRNYGPQQAPEPSAPQRVRMEAGRIGGGSRYGRGARSSAAPCGWSTSNGSNAAPKNQNPKTKTFHRRKSKGLGCQVGWRLPLVGHRRIVVG